MPKVTISAQEVETKFYTFIQNNSDGRSNRTRFE